MDFTMRTLVPLPHFLRIRVASRIETAAEFHHRGRNRMYRLDFAGSSKIVLGTIAGFTLLAGVAAAQTPDAGPDVTGVWIDHTGQGAVEISTCGNRVCGRVVWLKNPNHKSRSGKRICGTQVLGDLRKSSNSAWGSGWIYNPEDEERFSAELQLANTNTLLVTGYLGIKLLGETFTWRRATGALERCTTDANPK
jgi:uncharacterized protein (DUF2147 family)